jgi:hypothetical protein
MGDWVDQGAPSRSYRQRTFAFPLLDWVREAVVESLTCSDGADANDHAAGSGKPAADELWAGVPARDFAGGWWAGRDSSTDFRNWCTERLRPSMPLAHRRPVLRR